MYSFVIMFSSAFEANCNSKMEFYFYIRTDWFFCSFLGIFSADLSLRIADSLFRLQSCPSFRFWLFTILSSSFNFQFYLRKEITSALLFYKQHPILYFSYFSSSPKRLLTVVWVQMISLHWFMASYCYSIFCLLLMFSSVSLVITCYLSFMNSFKNSISSRFLLSLMFYCFVSLTIFSNFYTSSISSNLSRLQLWGYHYLRSFIMCRMFSFQSFFEYYELASMFEISLSFRKMFKVLQWLLLIIDQVSYKIESLKFKLLLFGEMKTRSGFDSE